jgi:hypothetical protein
MNHFPRFARDNGLPLAFGTGFLVTALCQAVAGRARYDAEVRAPGAEPVGFARYVAPAGFAVAVTENRRSEYPRFFPSLFGTVRLLRRGPPDSKPVGASHGATGVEG